ncbi:MAG: Sensor histidine kinase RcsC [Syntrophus sp. SKADARSKE-3]|nr:Sensor histidine kinase RcsC [Syntrophus sp. SKADARSKE-3]
MKSRLFYKIFATYVFLVLLVTGVLDFLLTPHIRDVMTNAIEDRMIGHGKILSVMPGEEVKQRLTELAIFSDSRLTLINASGSVLADSGFTGEEPDNHLNRPEIQEARVKGQGRAIRYSRTLRENMLYVALPLKEGSHINGYVRLARPLDQVRKAIEQVNRYVYLTLFIIAIPALILSFIFARNITSPIRRMTDFANKIRDGEEPAAIIMDSGNEIGELARDLNHILEEQKEKIRLATEEKKKLEAAFASMVEGILILDGNHRIEASNRSMRHILGNRNENMIGKTLLEAFRSVPLQNALNHLQDSDAFFAEGITLGDDDPIIVDVNISEIHGLPGNEKKIIMVFHDVTRLKRLERMRSDFITNVSHELKTPLTSIIGYVETLQDGAIEDKPIADRFMGIIHDHAKRLDRLVNDLLTLSNLEHGDTEIRLEPLALNQVIDNILPIIQAKVNEKDLTIVVDLPESLPQITGDRDKVTQVFLNILDNAVKFTASGQITIKAYPSGAKDYVTIQVEDTGLGIQKSDIPRLGERFYRVDSARSREMGGTGLGLSIVKHMMKALKGWMEIQSQMGKGTTVFLNFPIVKQAED